MKKVKIDVEKYTEEQINDSFDKVVLLSRYEYNQGTLIKELDKPLFRLCVLNTIDQQVKEGHWIEKDGDYYILEPYQH